MSLSSRSVALGEGRHVVLLVGFSVALNFIIPWQGGFDQTRAGWVEFMRRTYAASRLLPLTYLARLYGWPLLASRFAIAWVLLVHILEVAASSLARKNDLVEEFQSAATCTNAPWQPHTSLMDAQWSAAPHANPDPT